MIDSEKYADSAQGRELDRRLEGRNEPHWATRITDQQAEANNLAWLSMIRRQEESRKASSKRLVSEALGKMEAICGNGRKD